MRPLGQHLAERAAPPPRAPSLGHDQRARRDPARRRQRRHRARHQRRAIGRIEEHQPARRARRRAGRVGRQHARATSAPQAAMLARRAASAARSCSMKVAVRGAARQRLQPQRAGAGEGVQHRARPRRASRPPQGACSSMSNSAWRTRSAVGRVAAPAGATQRRPRQAPATILTARSGCRQLLAQHLRRHLLDRARAAACRAGTGRRRCGSAATRDRPRCAITRRTSRLRPSRSATVSQALSPLRAIQPGLDRAVARRRRPSRPRASAASGAGSGVPNTRTR